ncbi:PI-PLC X domain-containing protein 1 isoform X2 [Sceloporus undulatus]|uniref:PI-PLC X domain-containing protein 1 isoform X2 n=1 Tax=Sceloporus undulatus TaxID=8520 RepID=UPI001C4B95BA|nr:PI-PLC X domain-containing protein 1 isoform X2 [Sceloporus undulatus]XP_042315869.1 PI-PLC X domain-containing protein 1 isoform X2 [Sceloporus undulatus]
MAPVTCSSLQTSFFSRTSWEKMKERLKKKSVNWYSDGPQWMSNLPECLWSIPLSNLSLPGSHDAMTYCLDKESKVSVNESKLLQFMDKHMHRIVHPIILKWSITQTLTVLEQLDAGIRYFDFRIAHKPDDSSTNLYFVHMVYTTVVVEAVLWDILRWLKNHPWEVVILAFRNFDGLDEEHHCHLISCIKKIFAGRLCPRNVVPTLRNLWSGDYQVIVSYEEVSQVTRHCELWPAIPYWWGDKTTAEKLIQYLERRKQNGRPAGLFVAGINLTGDLGYILAHLRGSLKEMTLKALPFLNLWIKKQCPGSKKDCINIIAGDFIEKNDFVKNVIDLNRKLLK